MSELVDAEFIPQGHNVSSHSLRRGGATYLAAANLPDWLIQEMGRWRTDAFKLYTEHKWSDVLDKLSQLT